MKFIEKACWELQLWKHSTPQIMKKFLLLSVCLSASFCLRAADSVPNKDQILPTPAQDQGLPYTRSAQTSALAKIKGTIAVCSGSRYGYVNGLRVRLDQQEALHGGEAVMIDGELFVPAGFAAVLDLKDPAGAADKSLYNLADRWVHTLTLPPIPTSLKTRDVDGKLYVALAQLAKEKGFTVSNNERGLLFIGKKKISFTGKEKSLLDCVVSLFDTPDRFADPSIAPAIVPTLKQQGIWTDHIKVSSKDHELLNGPETKWPTAPVASYDTNGFNAALLGSKVPAPGIYPRLLFSPEDLPSMGERVKKSVLGQQSLIQMEELFKKSWWDPSTSDGQVFKKLSTGDLAGLEWDMTPGMSLGNVPQQFKGQKPGIHNSHVAYVPECLTSMALYCLLTGDEEHGKAAAAAIANYFKLREPLIDQWNQLSDSEFGSTPYNGSGAVTCWRGMHGLAAQMNLGLALDFGGKWMNEEQKEIMHRVIVKATYGRRPYGQDSTVRFRDVNWVAWDLPHYLALAAIEGLPGVDPEGVQSDLETVRAFCDWGVDEKGVVYESNGKTPGSLQFQTLSMIIMARRGENLFAHPHWRKFLEGQVQMTSPTGKVTVNSGTQYAPYSRQELSMMFINEQRAFFPENKCADYLLSQSLVKVGPEDEYYRTWLPQTNAFDPETYRKEVASMKRLRLPSISYPGFVSGVLYNNDYKVTSRGDIGLPLDFSDPVHGVFSSYSDRTSNAAWINMMVRPDHYYGAGHHHADAGMFHFSGEGVDWFTQTAYNQVFDGRYFNLVQVDGRSEAEPGPQGITAYNGAAKWIGSTNGESGAVASADLTYAYSWRWMTQPPGIWNATVQGLGWSFEPTERIREIFAGTARNKMRPWWLTYNTSNYIATSRALFNPMEYVYRTTGLSRGNHPYGLVIDDLRKDGAEHLYQWCGMLSGGVWEAAVTGAPKGSLVLGYDRSKDVSNPAMTTLPPYGKGDGAVGALKPVSGDPLLLVLPLTPDASNDKVASLISVEKAKGPLDKKGVPQPYDRLVISTRSQESHFKVLLIPFRMGEPMPSVTYDDKSFTATLRWGDQCETLVFAQGSNGKTDVTISREGKVVVASTLGTK